MFEKTNWKWVKDWTGRVAATAFLLLTFAFLAGGNVMRPGGLVDALPGIMFRAILITIPVALIALFFFARHSHRQGGRHDS